MHSFTRQHPRDTAHWCLLLQIVEVKTSVSDLMCLHNIIRDVNNNCHCRSWSNMLSNYLSYFGLATFCIISIIMGIECKPVIPLIVQFVRTTSASIFMMFHWSPRVAHALFHLSSELQRKDPLMKTRLIMLSSEWLQKRFLLRKSRVGSPFVLLPSSLKNKVKPHNECLCLHFRVLFMRNMPVWM